ncbi:hypothetical protein [Novosphingobium beihaiensis]|uniref:Uncharacterized protein n=1 Tax=Novosphingobium beihaiensis TaxID=2930389 RepID=A0ABT0BMS8_9SPHN|nr:hypothetical protein [Novosphingobium beihaiensis]MCJ2186356.1 hypothetical protein [Novosphingobium beihaiensis]
MPTEAAPNLVDWLTLAVAAFGSAAATFSAIWIASREDREVFDLHISWQWFGGGKYAELPFVYISNRSKQSIIIVDIEWLHGALKRCPDRGTALFYEDPGDLNFPYEVPAGSTEKLFLDEDGARNAFEKASKFANWFGWLGRSSMWLRVTTVRGTKKFIGGETALRWADRPRWVTGEK